MIATLAQIWRHPIKGIGAEPLDQAALSPDRPIPLDRAWAMLENGREAAGGWQSCTHFIRGAKGASLMAVTCRTADDGTFHLSHPERPDLTLDPEAEDASTTLAAWLRPIYPETCAAPSTLIAAPAQGMSDADFPSISVLGTASLMALSRQIGRPLDPRRFRGNLWLDGLAPFAEFDLVGKTLRIGTATLEIVEPITRCRATEANPETGLRDAPTLQTLQATWGHTDFGVYARVTQGGTIASGDEVTLA